MRRWAVALFLFLCPAVALADFVRTPTPTHDGTRATADLPVSQHKRNVGGSDKAGLCVYTSVWHSAIWQDSRNLFEFRRYMESKPGGSYPQKFDKTLKDYCASRSIPIPAYIQHTGGDVEFLRLALKTGRMPAVTYCGVDGPGRYGSEVIAHMVSLVYLDDHRAAIVDNNFPGNWLWMTAAEFVGRWKGIKPDGTAWRIGGMAVGGAWAIVLLDPPPVPYPAIPAAAWPDCPCGPDCKCPPGECPGGCAAPQLVGQCGPNGCAVPRPWTPPPPEAAAGATAPPGLTPPSNRHEWGWIDGHGYGWRFKVATPQPMPAKPVEAAPAPATNFPSGGVDGRRIVDPLPRYSLKGIPITAADARAALTLKDDSGCWNLAAVGDESFVAAVRADVERLPADLRAKLHVQGYTPDSWQAAQFMLKPGVTLRKPAANRVGADVGAVAPGEYTAAKLVGLMERPGGPTPKAQPDPAPQPTPAPTPGPTPTPNPWTPPAWVLGLLALLAYLFGRQ